MSIISSISLQDQFNSGVFSSESYITNRTAVEKRDELWNAIQSDTVSSVWPNIIV